MSITEVRPRSPRRRRAPPETNREFPSPLPRPRNELADLRQAWIMPKGWRVLSAVNNNIIGTSISPPPCSSFCSPAFSPSSCAPACSA